VNGAVNVCSGNYCPVGWRGNTKALVENGSLYAVTVRMNDYCLESDSAAQRRYTLCHEIGHAIGLAHTDENYSNATLGNCMVFTN
jgi:predicted Zn-dependent protease